MHAVKNGHVSIRQVPLGGIQPAPENDTVYRPIDRADPDFRALVASVREHGIKEPLLLTTDYYIISGHRRYAAASEAGLHTVPCLFESVSRYDPESMTLLVTCNKQRVKTVAEMMREEVVAADPDDAYQALVEYRRAQAQVTGETIAIEGRKHRAEITRAKRPFLDAIRAILAEYRDSWPLSVRQIHYYLLNDPPLKHASKSNSGYQNTLKDYKSLDELVTRARLSGAVPFDAIHDPTRPVVSWRVYRSPQPFIRRSLDGFLQGYCRDLLQSQPNHIELVGEKNTIEGIIRPVLSEYCIPYTIGRGYSSLPPRYQMRRRFERSGKDKLVLLVLSDFDPEGEDIGHSFARSMRDDFGIENIVPIKVALTADQVEDEEFGLVPQMKAKVGSSRSKSFVERHGDDVFELEALKPNQLREIVTDAIDGVLDLDAFNAEMDAERRDAAELDRLRRQALLSLDAPCE
jgi:hypothetical protein